MATFEETSTQVPIAGERSVTIKPGQPWPSAYRGSRYSVVSSDNYNEPVLQWKQRDLKLFSEVPRGLRRALVLLGKEKGLGSFRVTAGGELITKIPADRYSNVEQAPISEGWIPVYVGRFSGDLGFDDVDLDPSISKMNVEIWRGLPFNHGERWSVTHDDSLVWRWKDYEFESAFDHSELIAAYKEYRPKGGYLYVTEYGHVWINLRYDDVAPAKASEIRRAVSSWKRTAEETGDTSTLRLVNRRLVATSSDDDPSNGCLPIHLGYLRHFDDGVIPRPVVDDETYYAVVGQYETVWE